jgi:hypothetical protein
MQVIRGIWDFIQSQILGMKWLNDLIGSGLTALGLDTSNHWIGYVGWQLCRGYINQYNRNGDNSS